MKKINTEYYVYVYIDPRNYEEFYYGKGKGDRKYAHLSDESDTEKVRRIKAIQKENLEPIIKVIAKDLTESEALLIEKTLIWKLGKNLTNISSGHYAKKFRPHDTMHKSLPSFDFHNGIYYVNVGESRSKNGGRRWEECRQYGFLAAGQGAQWSDPLRELSKGDVVVAYLKGHGYVGIGQVLQEAVRPTEFMYKGKALDSYISRDNSLFRNCDNEKSDYLVTIGWKCSVERGDAYWKKNAGLFTAQRVKVNLQNQSKTLDYVSEKFGIDFKSLKK